MTKRTVHDSGVPAVTVSGKTPAEIEVRNFRKRGDALEVPDLTQLQTAGYERFLQLDAASSDERDTRFGLEALLREVFPIESYDGTMFLDYLSYELEEPRYTADECRELRLTYGLPFKIKVRLRRETHPDLPEEDIYLGEFPVLMGGGEFIVNGAERVIVSQLHRSPGVDFSIVSSEADRPLHSARVIPERGSWIELEVTKKDVLAMRIDQSTKLAATTFLRCLDASVASTDAIISLFYEVSEVKAKDVRAEDYAAASIIDTETGEEIVHEGRMIGEENAEAIQNSSIKTVKVVQNPSDTLILNTIAEEKLDQIDADSDHERALLKVYGKLRPGNPPQVDKAMQLFQEKFFDDNRYRLGRVGRFRINRKFNLDVPEDQMFIRGEDFLRVIQYILDLRSNRVDPDTGRPTYDKKKGTFVWENDVRPTLLYSDGKWNRMMIGTNEQYTSTPVDLGSPSADYTTPGAMIYPFKKMIGNQPADANNNTMLVPHLFGMKGGPNPFWAKFDWDLALRDGAEYAGQTYSGAYEFVPTFMYLTVNHEIAPAEEAYGKDGACADCHLDNKIDWQALGWTDDPIGLIGGTRPPAP